MKYIIFFAPFVDLRGIASFSADPHSSAPQPDIRLKVPDSDRKNGFVSTESLYKICLALSGSLSVVTEFTSYEND